MSEQTPQQSSGHHTIVRLGVAAIIFITGLAVCGSPPVNLIARLFSPASYLTDITGGSGDWYQTFFTAPPQEYDPAHITDDVTLALLDHINSAQRSIHIAAFQFDLTPVADALIAAHNRGVEVKWFTDDEHGIGEDDEAGHGQFRMLQQAGIPVRDDARTGLMHNKFIVFDGAIAWTGSTNLTESSIYRSNNNVIVIESPEIAGMYEREFAELWRGRSGGESRSTVFRQRITLADTPVVVLFGPEDDVIDNLLPLIRNARSRIRFLAFSFTDDDLGEELVRRSRQGVTVQGVFETRNASSAYSEVDRLYCNGLDVRLDGNSGDMHHKVFIIDDKIVVTGSFNFSGNADETNDENMILLNNTDLAARYNDEFAAVWSLASAPGSVNCSPH